MATYTFETPVDMADELLKVLSPRELANYLHHNHREYVKDLQWELETEELDWLYEGYDTYEEFASSKGQLSFSYR